MSIILDALNKADKKIDKIKDDESKVGGEATGMFNPHKKKSLPKLPQNKQRVIVLAGVAVLAVILTAVFVGPNIMQILSRKSNVANIQLKPKTQAAVKKDDLEKNEIKEKINKLKQSAAYNFRKGIFEVSATDYKELLDLLPSEPEVYNNYGVVLKKMGKLTEAKKAYETAIALDGNYPEALNNLGVILMQEGHYQDAKKAFKKAIVNDEGYIDPHLHLAMCLEHIGDLGNAVKNYEEFLNLSIGKLDRKIRIQVESRIAKIKEDM